MTTEDQQHLKKWYEYAAKSDGYIGGALRSQRMKEFLFQEQQRTILGIPGEHYNDLWLRLQAMPLPRSDQFAEDLQRIVAKVTSEGNGEATIDVECLGELIRSGLK